MSISFIYFVVILVILLYLYRKITVVIVVCFGYFVAAADFIVDTAVIVVAFAVITFVTICIFVSELLDAVLVSL